MRLGFRALALCAIGPVALSQEIFHDFDDWIRCGTPVLTESFADFTEDTDFEISGGVLTYAGQLEVDDPGGYRNFIDTGTPLFPDNNGTHHASCYVNRIGTTSINETRIRITFPSPPTSEEWSSFGCKISRGAGSELVQLEFFDGTNLEAVSVVASDAIDQFLGFVAATGDKIDSVRFSSSTLIPQTQGEGFGLDDVMLGLAEDCAPTPPPPTCYDSRTTFLAECGKVTDTEDFESFTIDTDFRGASVPIGTNMTLEAQAPLAFRNMIDVAPFDFADHNGSRHASCYVNWDTPTTEVTVDLGTYAIGFGCDVTAGLGASSEGVEIAGLLNGEVVVACTVAGDGTDQFVGLACYVDQVRFRAASLVPGGVGEGFSFDNVVVCGSEVAAVTMSVADDASAGSGQFVRVDVVDGSGALVDTSGSVEVLASQTPETTALDLATALNAGPNAGRVSAVARDGRLTVLSPIDALELRVCVGGGGPCASTSFPVVRHGQTYSMPGAQIGTQMCVPTVPNSTCLPATIVAVGRTTLAHEDVSIIVSRVPAGETCFFLGSQTPGFIANPGGSSGNLCITGNLARYTQAGQVGSGPAFSLEVGNIDFPLTPPMALVTGSWYWQAWYRDGSGSNFSDTVHVVLQ